MWQPVEDVYSPQQVGIPDEAENYNLGCLARSLQYWIAVPVFTSAIFAFWLESSAWDNGSHQGLRCRILVGNKTYYIG